MYSPPINATVLLVDDQPFMRNAIRGVLHGYKDIQIIGEASDGVEAIQYARMLKPHVVLMDIRMPKMDGVQATRAIKRRPRDHCDWPRHCRARQHHIPSPHQGRRPRLSLQRLPRRGPLSRDYPVS